MTEKIENAIQKCEKIHREFNKSGLYDTSVFRKTAEDCQERGSSEEKIIWELGSAMQNEIADYLTLKEAFSRFDENASKDERILYLTSGLEFNVDENLNLEFSMRCGFDERPIETGQEIYEILEREVNEIRDFEREKEEEWEYD